MSARIRFKAYPEHMPFVGYIRILLTLIFTFRHGTQAEANLEPQRLTSNKLFLDHNDFFSDTAVAFACFWNVSINSFDANTCAGNFSFFDNVTRSWPRTKSLTDDDDHYHHLPSCEMLHLDKGSATMCFLASINHPCLQLWQRAVTGQVHHQDSLHKMRVKTVLCLA